MFIKKLLLIAAVIIIFPYSSCFKTQKHADISIPASPVLIEKYSWAVCNTTNMHMYSGPDMSSDILSTIWKASIVEIISRSPKHETINGRDSYWFRIKYNDMQGWVFGSFLQFQTTYKQAVLASRSM